MPKILEKVVVNGKKLNKCPICGEHCSIGCWERYQTCSKCHKLIKQSLDINQIKKIRADEISGNALLEKPEVIDTPISVTDIYNFRTSFPLGMKIFVRDKEEAKHIKDVYRYYSHYGDSVPEFNVLIGQLLQAKLDLYRNSSKRSDPEISARDYKDTIESDVKLSETINKIARLLDSLKDRVNSQSGNIITSEFQKMLEYKAKHDHEYTGIGECPECKNRIIFKTNFTTFKAWMLETMAKVRAKLELNDSLDKKTLNLYNTNLEKELTDKALVKTYVVEHMRQMEATLLQSSKER
jgi:hypothetical protein